jgi:hypothetical protein
MNSRRSIFTMQFWMQLAEQWQKAWADAMGLALGPANRTTASDSATADLATGRPPEIRY